MTAITGSVGPTLWQGSEVTYSLVMGGILIVLALMGWMILSWVLRQRRLPDLSPHSRIWPRLVETARSAETLDILLCSFMRILADEFRADAAAMVKYSAHQNCLFGLDALGLTAEELQAMTDQPPDQTIFHAAIVTRAVAVPQPAPGAKTPETRWVIMPLLDGDKPIAALALRGTQLTGGDPRFLSHLGHIQDFLSLAATDFITAAKGRIEHDAVSAAGQFDLLLANCDSIEKALGETARALGRACPVDYVSLARLDRASQSEMRWSILLDGGKLIERHHPIQYGNGGELREAQAAGCPVICTNLLDLSPSPVEARFGMRSRLRIPLTCRNTCVGTLIIAERRAGQYSTATLPYIQPLLEILAHWLAEYDRQRSTARLDRYLEVLNRLQNRYPESAEQILEAVREALDVTAVCLLDYDGENRSFGLCGSSQVRPVGRKGTLRSRIPADCLPWHKYALSGERACLIDQSDPERLMSSEESRLTMPEGFKTGLLAPVSDGEHSLGILAAAEMRHPVRRRFADFDRTFLLLAGSRLGEALKGNVADGTPRRFADTSIAPLVAAPLTTIMGSVELIRQAKDNLPPQTDKYLHNIESAANRIKDHTRNWDRHVDETAAHHQCVT